MMLVKWLEHEPWVDAGRSLLDSEWTPAVDIRETKDQVVVKAELPGILKEDLEVSLKDGLLVIRGEKKASAEAEEHGYLRTERLYGKFYRALALPAPVESGKAKATFRDGVLELTFPKTEESKPKRIGIE